MGFWSWKSWFSSLFPLLLWALEVLLSLGLGEEVPDCDLVRLKAPTAPCHHHHKAIHANTEPYTVCIVVYCFFSHGHACSCGHLKTPRLSWTQRHTKGGHPDANAPAFALGRPGRGFLIVQSKFELWLFDLRPWTI